VARKKETYYKEGVKVEVVNKGVTLPNGKKNPLWWHVITTLNGRFWYQPLSESTKGARYLLDYYKSLKSYKYKQIADRDYNRLPGSEWWSAKKVGKRVWVQYPVEWFTYDAENKAIQAAKELI
jgi:hypothetical protein